MSQPVPVYLEVPDHDAIERELDRQLGIEPKPRRERAWDCLAGEAERPCGHHRIDVDPIHDGLAHVTCRGCGHSWKACS